MYSLFTSLAHLLYAFFSTNRPSRGTNCTHLRPRTWRFLFPATTGTQTLSPTSPVRKGIKETRLERRDGQQATQFFSSTAFYYRIFKSLKTF